MTPNSPTPERVAQLIAHRACCGTEHDPLNGKLHGYCVVCGVPWPCEYAGTPPVAAPEPAEPTYEPVERCVAGLTEEDFRKAYEPDDYADAFKAEPAEPSVPANGVTETVLRVYHRNGEFFPVQVTDYARGRMDAALGPILAPLYRQLAQARAENEQLRASPEDRTCLVAAYMEQRRQRQAAEADARELRTKLEGVATAASRHMADARALREEVAELNAACSRENRAWNDEAREHATLRERVADIAKRFRHAATFMLADSAQAHIACAEMLEREIAILSTPPSAPSGEDVWFGPDASGGYYVKRADGSFWYARSQTLMTVEQFNAAIAASAEGEKS